MPLSVYSYTYRDMKLTDWRRAAGLTQARLAEQLGTSQPTIAKYEAGTIMPGRRTMPRIVDATAGAVTPNDFYDVRDGTCAA